MRAGIGGYDSAPGDRSASDGVLLDRIGAGDPAAFGELASRYGTTLYTLAYEILLDAVEADRIVARTLSEVRRDAVRGLSGPFPVRWWLTELARAHALDALRSRKRQTRLPPRPQDVGPASRT